jgi:hypothetical protein
MVGLLLSFFCFAATSLWAEDLTHLKQRALELTQTLETQSQEIGSTNTKLDQLSRDIQSLKSQKRGRMILGSYRLQTKLQEAQELSDRLSAMTESHKKIEQELRNLHERYARELDDRIERNRTRANNKSEAWIERSRAAREMDLLLAERAQISMGLSAFSPPSTSAKLIQNHVTTDDVTERLDAIRDFERRLLKEISLIERELADVRRQRFLRSELSHLMDEESFFGEQGFVRAGTAQNNKDKESGTETSLTKTASTTTTPGSSGFGSQAASGASSSAKPTSGETQTASIPQSTTGGGTTPSSKPSNPAMSGPSAPPANVSPATSSSSSGSTASAPLNTDTSSVGGSLATSEKGSATMQGVSALDSTMGNLDAKSRDLKTPGNTITGNLDSGTLAVTSSEKMVRDPLAQLAAEFGIPLEQKKDVTKSVVANNSNDAQTDWLEKRIRTSRFILDRIREKMRELEKRLHP